MRRHVWSEKRHDKAPLLGDVVDVVDVAVQCISSLPSPIFGK